MKTEDFETVVSWYSALVLLLLPLPLFIIGVIKAPIILLSSIFLGFIGLITFFDFPFWYIGPPNLSAVFKLWLGFKADISVQKFSFGNFVETTATTIKKKSNNIPHALSQFFLIVAVISLCTLMPTVLVLAIMNAFALNPELGRPILYVAVGAILLFIKKIIELLEKAMALFGLLFYKHLSQGGTFFKLLNFHLAIFFLGSPFVILFAGDNLYAHILQWLNDVMILSLFGVFVDFALYLAFNYGWFGRAIGFLTAILGLLLGEEAILLLFAIVGIEAAIVFMKGNNQVGKVSVPHTILMGVIGIAVYFSNEILAMLSALFLICYFAYKSFVFAKEKREVTIC